MEPSEKQKDDLRLVRAALEGRQEAFDAIVRQFESFIRLKARTFFMAGGDTEDLVQEGLFGLTKAIKDYRADRGTTFRGFAELCITRQIITAIKSAARRKHEPLNNYMSLNSPLSSHENSDCFLADILSGPSSREPFNQVVLSDEMTSLMDHLSTSLSDLEAGVLSLSLDGCSYEEIAGRLGCKTKSVDNARQRIKRKVELHLQSRR